jgi:thioredoxin 1
MKQTLIALISILFLAACQPSVPASTNSSINSIPSPTSSITNNSATPGPESAQDSPSRYGIYEADRSNIAAEGYTVLFFHAKWCPTCRAAEADIIDNLHNIPPTITILKVDYDAESELKKQYSIVSQHTFVVVDANGMELTKWNGGGLTDIIRQVDSL